MATIRDVARLAGVSTATVSRWMNRSLTVRPDTASRIQTAIGRLQYAPNPVARALATKASLAIGVLLADISNPFFASLARAVEDAAQMEGYVAIVCNSDSDPAKESAYVHVLRQRYVDGILFLSKAGLRSQTSSL